MRRALVAALALAAVLTVSAVAASAGSVDLPKVFSKQIAAINAKTSVPVFLPGSLPFAGKVPKLYATGGATARAWDLELAGAPNCGGATACFFASFEAKKGGKLPRTANARLSGGDPAVFQASRCGASCSPATLWFTHLGVLYTWSDKVLVARSAKSVLVQLASSAIAAGPRTSSSATSSYCSPSGDVCVQVVTQKSDVLLEISTVAKYFNSYLVCVQGPKSRVCKSFPIHTSGSEYGSTVSWKKSFPNQGHGTYRVTWNASAKTLSFTR
jgi:hypothetical protein